MFQGKNVYLSYIQEVYKKKSYFKPGINSNATLSINVDGSALTYWVLPAHSVKHGNLGDIHTPSSGQIRGLNARTVAITTGEIIDVLVPAAAKLAGAAVVDGLFVQNTIKAMNNINEAFVEAVETGAKDIDSDGYVDGDGSYTSGKKITYTAGDPVASITKLKAAFNKKNATSGYKATSLLVSSDVYADLQAKNLLIYKPISQGTETVDIYNFLGLDVVEVPELTSSVVLFHRDGVYGAANLNFVVENENDSHVPGGLSIKG